MAKKRRQFHKTKKIYKRGNLIIEETNEVIIPNTVMGLASKILAATDFTTQINALTKPEKKTASH